MIEVKHLTKRYGAHAAVEDLSFRVEKGMVYGFLGPNGAGKSTTMNIITGGLAATEGTVTIGGFDIFEQPREAKRLIGYLPEQPPIYPEMTPREYLTFVAKAKGIARADIESEVARVMQVTGTDVLADRLCRNLSKGYAQRVGIAQALLGKPEVIILDEPTVGLDPKQMIEIRNLIQTLGQEHTVILSSHILSEVQAVCSRILMISHGKLVADDTPENLEKLLAGTARVTVRLACSEGQEMRLEIPDTRISEHERESETVVRLVLERVQGNSDALCEEIFWACSEQRLPILSMNGVRASLEDVFLELTQGGASSGEQAAQPPKPEQDGVQDEQPEEAAAQDAGEPETDEQAQKEEGQE